MPPEQQQPAEESHETNALRLLAVVLLAMLMVGLGAWWYTTRRSETSQVVCTQEVMQCPDGSYVGRTGTNCEFVSCPSVEQNPVSNVTGTSSASGQVAGWQTYRNEEYGFEFKYPLAYSLEEDSSMTGQVTTRRLTLTSKKGDFNPVITIKKNINDLPLGMYADQIISDLDTDGVKSREEVIMGGRAGIYIQGQNRADDFFIFGRGDYIYALQQPDILVKDNIFSTFKFDIERN